MRAAQALAGGRRRRRRRGRGPTEGAPVSTLGRVQKVLKDSQVISKALNEFGNPFGFGGVAATLGYGRRRRPARRIKGGMAHSMYVRPMMGGGNLNY
jgi:hypothetical protein